MALGGRRLGSPHLRVGQLQDPVGEIAQVLAKLEQREGKAVGPRHHVRALLRHRVRAPEVADGVIEGGERRIDRTGDLIRGM